jgi:DNA-binding NtrC family response regulator
MLPHQCEECMSARGCAHTIANSRPSHGPSASVAQAIQSAAATSKPIQPHKAHLLLVDDEKIICEVAAALLQELGYEVTWATDSRSAVKALERAKGSIELVIVDMNMPDATGVECFAALRAIAPELKGLLATGYGAGAYEEEVAGTDLLGILPKPFTLTSMSDKVGEALSA